MKVLGEESKKIKKEIKEKTIGYVLAAFGFVVGLAWNEAIKALIENYFPVSGEGVAAKVIYALALTAVTVLASVYLVRKISEEK